MFGVFFSVIGSLAPVEYVRRTGNATGTAGATGDARDALRVVLRWPLSGAVARRADHLSLVVFILFMLSSTTYDAIHETYLWIGWYWQRLLPGLEPIWGTDVIAAPGGPTPGDWWDQWLGLVASPAFYFALYVAALALAVAITRLQAPLTTLARQFVFS